MKKIKVTEYAQQITEALTQGVLLCTNGDKFNAMVIGWGALGTCWSVSTFTVYVRENRYTRSQLDKTGEFTVSIPLGRPSAQITRICGGQSGRDVDKVTEAGLTLAEPQTIHTPAVVEYPLTLECRVLYSQRQELSRLPKEIREKSYPQDVDGFYPMANRDPHTAYIGQIVDAYILE